MSFVILSRLIFHPCLAVTLLSCHSTLRLYEPHTHLFIFSLVVVYSPEMEKLPEMGDRTASVLLISWMCVRVCGRDSVQGVCAGECVIAVASGQSSSVLSPVHISPGACLLSQQSRCDVLLLLLLFYSISSEWSQNLKNRILEKV